MSKCTITLPAPSAFYPCALPWSCLGKLESLPCWKLFTKGFPRDSRMDVVSHFGQEKFGQMIYFSRLHWLGWLSASRHNGYQWLTSAWDIRAHFMQEETEALTGSTWYAVLFACFLWPGHPKASTCHTKGFPGGLWPTGSSGVCHQGQERTHPSAPINTFF